MNIAIRAIAGLLSVGLGVFFIYGIILSRAFGSFGGGSAHTGFLAFMFWATWLGLIFGLAGIAAFGGKRKNESNE